MQRQLATKQPAPIPGVISTIADGFSMALWRPMIVIVPLLLDLYYWIGWKIEVGSFAVSLQRWMLDLGIDRTDANMLRIARISQWDVTTAPSFFFVPSLLSGVNPSRVYQYQTRRTYSTHHWGFDVAIMLGIFVLSMLVAAIFLGVLGDKALDCNPSLRARIVETGRICLRLTGVTLLAMGVVAIVSGIVLAERIRAGQDIGPVFTVALIVQFFISLGLWFAPDAIVMAKAGAFEAIRLSLRTFRNHFWSSMGFVAASVIFSQGLHDLFVRMAASAPGLILGVVLYAVFSSGLALASFWFFNSRNQQSRSAAARADSAPFRSSRSKEK
jgi:hypothetical protein